ncbi:hypothetical protein CJ030_MR1G014987 [Morella rubra]|uniref:Uncharacterized protein n=1 Tax=Morella rubra TaxID=262757 RepID=A0A6A1WP01_9ROSI|nr:hypothetical protein CJ030_MR1G014987 [Morella rubra]
MEMKRGRDFGGSDESGPKSKEKRRSLKLASHVTKKAVMPVGSTVVRERGRMVKRQKIGIRERNLSLPLGILEAAK